MFPEIIPDDECLDMEAAPFDASSVKTTCPNETARLFIADLERPLDWPPPKKLVLRFFVCVLLNAIEIVEPKESKLFS